MERITMWAERSLTLGLIKLISWEERDMSEIKSRKKAWISQSERSIYLCISEPKIQILRIYKLQSSC